MVAHVGTGHQNTLVQRPESSRSHIFTPYTLQAAIFPHPVETSTANTHYNTSFAPLISPHFCNAITHYSIVFIITLSSSHLVMPLRITTMFSSPHYHLLTL